MADEQAEQAPTIADLDQSLLTLSPEQWKTAGITIAGKVGFKILTSVLGAGRDKNGVFPRAELEVAILERPDQEVAGKGQRHWDKMRLDGTWLRNFKALSEAAGIKITGQNDLDLKEIISALAGRSAYGTIIHNEWTPKGSTDLQITAKFGNRFGKSFKDLG